MKVWFWVESPLSERDWKRFGFGVLQRRGIEVQCLDFTPILNPKFWSQYGGIQVQRPEVKTVHNSQEFSEMMDQWESGVVVDMLCSGEANSSANYLRQEAIGRVDGVIAIEGLNAVSIMLNPSGGLSKFWHILKNRDWQRLIRATMRGFGQARSASSFPNRPSVDLLICGGEVTRSTNEDHLVGAETLWAHTWDYDLYLEHKDRQSQREDYIVFLDSDMAFHSDYEHLNLEPYVTAEKYYQSMNRYFERLEQDLDLPVVISAHPRGQLDRYYADFQGREVVQGKTAEMVRDSSYVVTHSSTSDSFAVLWNKPMLVVSTDELERSSWYPYMEATCKVLGIRRTNADRLPRNADWKVLAERPKAQYDYYRNQLIKRDGTPERNSWELFADWLEQKEAA